MMRKKDQGFTLIEIAIVLTIVGLVVGAIVIGKGLIRAAELRGLYTELETFQSKMIIFEDKYLGKAGDLLNATNFWGALHTDATTCQTIAATDTRTCNGNGDGFIMVDEGFRMWQHLSNSGLYSGNYTGRSGPGGPNQAIRGVNVPDSRMQNIQYMVAYEPINHFLWFPEVKGNILFLGGTEAADLNQPWRPFLTAEELLSIDLKIDDGLAPSGKIVGQMNFVGWSECTTSNDANTARYNVALDGRICSFYGLLIN